MRTTITAALLVAGLALTGCGDGDSDKTRRPATPATTAPATLSKAEITEQCIDAIAEEITARKGDPAASEPSSDDRPKECEPLSTSDYLDAYLRGLHQSNQEARDELQRRIDEEAAKDAR